MQFLYELAIQLHTRSFNAVYYMHYYISEIVRTLQLVNLAGRILQYSPLNVKLCFLRALFQDKEI